MVMIGTSLPGHSRANRTRINQCKYTSQFRGVGVRGSGGRDRGCRTYKIGVERLYVGANVSYCRGSSYDVDPSINQPMTYPSVTRRRCRPPLVKLSLESVMKTSVRRHFSSRLFRYRTWMLRGAAVVSAEIKICSHNCFAIYLRLFKDTYM